MGSHSHDCTSHIDHTQCSLTSEIICHMPYAVFSASLALIVLTVLTAFSGWLDSAAVDQYNLDLLFHSFHFLHLVFAATGAMITFSRFSKDIVTGAIVALVSSFLFCTLSDILLPYVAGKLLGVNMVLHICFISELHNVIPFLGIGLINGIVMSRYSDGSKKAHSLISHFSHILISCLASLFYMVGQGLYAWHEQMGMVFVLLIIVVIIPCTLADVIIPFLFARHGQYK